MNAEYELIADISRNYFLTTNVDAKKRFFWDLEKMEKEILQMSKEEFGPWSVWGQKAKAILETERKKVKNQYEFIFLLILSLISAVAFFAGIFINQISLSYGSLLIPIGIAIFFNFFKKN